MNYGCLMEGPEKRIVTLIDDDGKKYIIRTGNGMKQIGKLGVVNTDNLIRAERTITISGK